MGTHDHHLPPGPALEQSARAALEKGGEQWTPLRAAVFGALSEENRPVSAYDVADRLSRSEGRRVAANSVYRILDLFVTHNLAQRVESRNAYLINSHPGCRHDCIFLICDACGSTGHIDDDTLAGTLRGTAQQAGFTPVRPVIEVHGRCAACAAA